MLSKAEALQGEKYFRNNGCYGQV